MASDPTCATVRPELSARLDEEVTPDLRAVVDGHLEHCAECRIAYAHLRRARTVLRLQPVGPVPDLTQAIMDAVRPEHARRERSARRRSRFRTAALAAAASALLVFGASLPLGERSPGIASAEEVARLAHAAARAVTGYRATFEIEERGWHPDIPVRRFRARIWFQGPEGFRLSLSDRTAYPDPGRWPRNDVELRSDGSGWWLREPSTCPVEALPGCPGAGTSQVRAITGRPPFDGTSPLPTDVVIPLEMVTGNRDVDVASASVMGRDAVRFSLAYRDAQTLIRSFLTGGSWRTFDGSEHVDVWLDRATWAPLRLIVTDPSVEQPLLAIAAVSFDATATPGGSLFEVPAVPEALDGGFRPVPGSDLRVPLPSSTAGLRPYVAGERVSGGTVVSFARGMTWLKLTYERDPRPVIDPSSEVVPLEGGGPGYYLPAGRSQRRTIVMSDGSLSIKLESNLTRAELIRVASSVGIDRVAIPTPRGVEPLGVALDLASFGIVSEPRFLPAGYRLSGGYRSSDGRTVVLFYRDPELEIGPGIRITASGPASTLTPSSETFEAVTIDGARGRWSAERGEVEWIDRGIYRAVAGPALDAATVIRIARSMR